MAGKKFSPNFARRISTTKNEETVMFNEELRPPAGHQMFFIACNWHRSNDMSCGLLMIAHGCSVEQSTGSSRSLAPSFQATEARLHARAAILFAETPPGAKERDETPPERSLKSIGIGGGAKPLQRATGPEPEGAAGRTRHGAPRHLTVWKECTSAESVH